MKRIEKIERSEALILGVNNAKDSLWSISNELESMGMIRSSKSLRTLVYKIEDWQNRQKVKAK